MTEIERIKQALAQATEKPWQQEGREVWHRGLSYDSAVDRHRWICDVISDADRNLIANAPTWLASLITTIESLQKDNNHLEKRMKENRSMAMRHANKVDEQAELIKSQNEEVAKLNEIIRTLGLSLSNAVNEK